MACRMFTENIGFNNYVNNWFEETRHSMKQYREPAVEDSVACFMKVACTSLKQDLHVFVSAVETLDNYVRIKERRAEPVEDPLLAAACTIFLCSKYAGGQSDLRASYIQEYLRRVVKKRYLCSAIKSQEFDIFRTINGEFLLYTIIDDMNILLETYVKSLNLKANLNNLCMALVKLFYACRNKIFTELKSIYQQNRQGLYAFQQCVCKRLYFPSGILLCALRMTVCRNFLNLNKIGKELGYLTSVHEDHLHFLCDVIYDTVTSDLDD